MKKYLNYLLNKNGQSLVETALVMPFILLIILGIIDFGRAFNAQIILSNSAREGSRYAALGKTDVEITAVIDSICTSLGTVTTNIAPAVTRVQGQMVTITVNYDYQPITPIVGPIIKDILGTDGLEASNTMRVE